MRTWEKLRESWARELPALLVLIAMVVWFGEEMIAEKKVPFFRDLLVYHYPNRFVLAQSFWAGELPLWSRQVAMGFPFFANPPAAVLYPLHAIFFLLPFFDALRFLFVTHYLIAASGAYCVCRGWDYPRYLALLGSALFTFGGAMVSLVNMMDFFETAAWLPWVVYGGDRLMRQGGWKPFLLLAALSLVQFSAGHPEGYLLSLVLLLISGLRARTEKAALSYPRFLLFVVLANGIVAGLFMVQLLPAVELFFQSWRVGGVSYAQASEYSLNPVSLLNLFFLDKNVNFDHYAGLHTFFNSEVPLLLSLYLSASAASGIVLWLIRSSMRERLVLGGLLFFAFLLALGHHTPVHRFVFDYFPLLRLFRFPEKFFFIAHGLLVFMILAGFYHLLVLDDFPRRRAYWALAAIPVLHLLPYLALRLDRSILLHFVSWARGIPLLTTETLKISSVVVVHLERQVLLTSAAFVILFLWKTGRLRAGIGKCLLLAVTVFDLSSAHRPYQFLLAPEVVPKTPVVLHKDNHELTRLFYLLTPSTLHPNAYAVKRRPFPESVSSVFAALVPNTGVLYDFNYVQELDSLRLKPYDLFLRYASRFSPEQLYRVLRALGVDYVQSVMPLPEGGVTLVGHFPEHSVWVYRVKDPVPRAYVVPGVTVEAVPERILDLLSSAGFDPLREIILDQSAGNFSTGSFRGHARLLSYTNHRVVARARLNAPGFLVLADSFYPGWRARVDDKEAKILRANLFFRAVPLPAGEHVVEFVYRPWSVMIGGVISALTLAVVILYVVMRSFPWDKGKVWLLHKLRSGSQQ